MREDVIEAPDGSVQLEEIACVKADIRADAGSRGGAGLGDGLLGQVDADELRRRRAERHVD